MKQNGISNFPSFKVVHLSCWWQQEISKFFTNSFSPPDPGAPAASKFDFLQTHILTSDTFANTKCLEIT